MKSVRLDRLLVNAGVGSRSAVGKLVRQGRIAVDAVIVHRPEEHVSPTAVVSVDGEVLKQTPLILVYHKPVGVLVTMDDPWGRATVATVLGPALASGMHPVGRLDADSSGLLLFSSNGVLTQRLLHPRRQVEKEYVATVDGVPEASLAQTLAEGVVTEEGVHRAVVVAVEGSTVRLVVTEGKHRMVRRMLANVGLPVLALHRVRLGAIRLDTLEAGGLRAAEVSELAWLDSLLTQGQPVT